MTAGLRKALAFGLAVVIPVGVAMLLPVSGRHTGPNGELPSNGIAVALGLLLGGALVYHLSMRALAALAPGPGTGTDREEH